jgi:hypothetical protein
MYFKEIGIKEIPQIGVCSNIPTQITKRASITIVFTRTEKECKTTL